MPPFNQYAPTGFVSSTESAKGNTSTSGNTSKSNTQLANGWVSEPDGRGTWDIIQTCVVTLILCSWSSLVLNRFSRKGRVAFMKDKLRWMLFTLFWPEVTLGVACEQWESASQCVEAYSKMRQKNNQEWTMRHAFFADMGGFLLKAPGFPAFPVDGQQLRYLIEKGYIPYPNVDTETIWDKNKADGFARAITLIQITWFTIQCIGRAIQHLKLSTLELLTINMIFCTVFNFYFWGHKPLDIQTPIILETNATIDKILIDAGDQAHEPYKLTPLDFITVKPAAGNFIATWWWGLALCFDGILFEMNEKTRPVSTFSNSRATPPRGYSFGFACFMVFISVGYFALHFAGWYFVLPTPIEQKLWRGTMIFFLALFSTYLIVFFTVTFLSRWIAKRYFGKEASSFIEVASLFPKWFQLGGLLPIYGSYGVVRMYIVIEAFISLRSLPITTYDSVNWSNFIPHF